MPTLNELSTRFATDWREFNASYDAYARSVGLSGTSLSVLSTILAADSECTQESIRATTLLPKQTVHNVIRGFVASGWLELAPSLNDRRAKVVRMTPAGETEARRLISPIRQAEIQALERLGKQDAERLVELFSRYGSLCSEIIAQAGGHHGYRMED